MNVRSQRKYRKHKHWTVFQDWPVLIIASGVAVFIAVVSSLGWFQPIEWAILDNFFRVRPLEQTDTRIVVVTITEEDIRKIKTWPIPDRDLAKVLSNLRAQHPRVIGLDVYRDLPVEPGHQELVSVFKSTPNLIGVQQSLSNQVIPPSSVLADLNQVADAQVLEDPDQRVRRALLTADQGGKVSMGLALASALKYLEHDNVTPMPVLGKPFAYQLGRVQIEPLQKSDGGYVQADALGYQILLNFRGGASSFQTLSFMDVLNNRVPEDWVRDRVVLIGTTAESIKDMFLTPYGNGRGGQSNWTPGVFIHANIISQILNAALADRPLLRGAPGASRWLWVLGGAIAGVLVCWNLLQASEWVKQFTPAWAIAGTVLASVAVLGVGYLLFLQGWWVPVAAPIVALNGAALLCFAYHSYKLQRLAYFDGLTQVANRRYFDLYLARQVQKKGSLSLILCDVDCFKLYNDTYGHQAGDGCLQQVAQAAQRALRNGGLVARYGGEEFVVVVPRAHIGEAALVAERILMQVRKLQIYHETSTAASYVTLSCGVVTIEIDDQKLTSPDWSGAKLIAAADEALYTSKKSGRDRYTLVEYGV